ncbi:MAG: fructosamine kinase family protein [Candidatus Hydrogenedentales bacterium]
MTDPAQAIADALGVGVINMAPLTGGCVGEVYRVELADGRSTVAKVDNGREPKLDLEGYMLVYLAKNSRLPVPAVYHSAPRLLIMELLPGASRFSNAAEEHAADLLAELHGVNPTRVVSAQTENLMLAANCFGFDRDTLIGGLHQPNPWSERWVPFFRDQRLLAMGKQAMGHGRFGTDTYGRLERFAEKLDVLLDEPAAPALLHGDVWSANVLADATRITGFIDPAIYFGHPEIELAFITLFSTFGDAFFGRYREQRSIAPDFFEVRRDIYNLYPLLVHVRLFGGGYLNSFDQILRRHGC